MQNQKNNRIKLSQKVHILMSMLLLVSSFQVQASKSCFALFEEIVNDKMILPPGLNFFRDAVIKSNQGNELVLLTPDQLDNLDNSFQVIDTRNGKRLTVQNARQNGELSILNDKNLFTIYAIDKNQIPSKQINI